MALNDSRRAIISLGVDPKGLDEGVAASRRMLAKMERDRSRAQFRAAKSTLRVEQDLQKKLAREAEKARKKVEREAEKKQRAARQTSVRRGGAVSSFVGGAAGGVAGAITNRVMDMASDAAKEVMDVERALVRFQIAGGRSAAETARFRVELNRTSYASGIARSELMEGAAAYVRLTGDAQGAQQTLGLFGKVANASGASMDDIASTAAALRKNLNIDPSQFQGAFDILITQGKAGAIELNELATLMAGIAPSFAAFKGGTGVSGMAQLSAAMQVGRGAFGTSSEAATGLRNFITSISKRAKQFGKHGIRIVEKDKNGVERLRDIRSIIMDIGNSKLGRRKRGLLREVFGGTEEYRFFDEMFAKIKDFDALVKAGGGNAVEDDSALYRASDIGKIELAINSAKMALVEAFTPDRIREFASALGVAAKWFADIVGYAQYIFGVSESQKQNQQWADRAWRIKMRKKGLTDKQIDAIPESHRQMVMTAETFDKESTVQERRDVNEQIQSENRLKYMMADDAPLVMNMKELVDLKKYAIPGTTNESELMGAWWHAYNRELKRDAGEWVTNLYVDGEPVVRGHKNAKNHRAGKGKAR